MTSIAWTHGPVGAATNACMGQGGQGEFLRTMVRTLERLEGLGHVVFARSARSDRVKCVELPFEGGWRRRVFGLLGRIPRLRGRSDWLMALSDEDFDRRVCRRAELGALSLLDGVMGHCCRAFEALAAGGGGGRRVLTCLNTHVGHLDGVLRQEEENIRAAGGSAAGRSFIHPAVRRRMRREIELADRIRVCSTFAKETFLAHGVAADRVKVIPIGIDQSHFRPVPPDGDGGVFRVLVVSSITPRKGVWYALRAFEEARLPNSELVLIGGTGDRWSKRLVAEYGARLGNVRNEQMDVMSAPVERHYGRCSVLLHPALEDGYGLIVPQALASGRPVIATRQTGASELIVEGETGFVVEARDVAAMTDRLRVLHGDLALRERMSLAAPATVGHLSYARCAEAVIEMYRGVIAHG